MNKQKIYEFDPQIYPRKLWVAVGVPFEELKDEFEDIDKMPESVDASVDYTRKLKPEVMGGVLVRYLNTDAMTTKIITHESAHIAVGRFDYIGAPIDIKHQEPFAYLCGWIAKCIEEVKQIEIEHSKHKEAQNDNTGTEREEAGS